MFSANDITTRDLALLQSKIAQMLEYYTENIRAERTKGIKSLGRDILSIFSKEAADPMKHLAYIKALADKSSLHKVKLVKSAVAERFGTGTLSFISSVTYVPVTETIQEVKPVKPKSSLTETEVNEIVESQVTTQKAVTTIKAVVEMDPTDEQPTPETDNSSNIFCQLVIDMESYFEKIVADSLKIDIVSPENKAIILNKINNKENDYHVLRMLGLILNNIYSEPRWVNGLSDYSSEAENERRVNMLMQVTNQIKINDVNHPFYMSSAYNFDHRTKK